MGHPHNSKNLELMEEYHQSQAIINQNDTSENDAAKIVNELNAHQAGGNHPQQQEYLPGNNEGPGQTHNLEIQEKVTDGPQVVDPNVVGKELHGSNDLANGENSMDVENTVPRNGQNFSNDITHEENTEG